LDILKGIDNSERRFRFQVSYRIKNCIKKLGASVGTGNRVGAI